MQPQRPPGPPPRGILGNFPMGHADPLATLAGWARQYGDVVYYRALHRQVYFLTHPDLVREVLLTQHTNFIKGEALRFNRRIFGEGLLTSEGAKWREQRRLIQPAFHREKIAACGAAVVTHAERQMAGWRQGEARDLYGEMMELALRIVCEALFRIELGAERDRFAAALDTILRLSRGGRMLLPPLLRLVPTPDNVRYLRAARTLDRIVYGVIRGRRTAGAEGDDLLSELLRTGMAERQIRDEVMTLLLAGHETTAVTLAWTWHLLAQHPETEGELHEELARVLAGRAPTIEDLPGLAVTGRIVKEAIRLYPPIWAIVRTALAPCELGGYRVPAGATILMSQYVTHRSPRFFQEPECFRPNRWLGEAPHKFAYFPFSAGPRACIGAAFANMEAVLLLATIAQRWQLRPAPGTRVEAVPTVTLRPAHGIWMTLTRRDGR